MSKIIATLKNTVDYPTIVIIVLTGIYTFISDNNYYKRKGLIKETKIIKGIMYSYITIALAMYVFLIFI